MHGRLAPPTDTSGRHSATERIAAALRGQVAQQNLTRIDLAHRLGVSAATVGRWLSGRHSINLNAYADLAGELGLDPLELWQTTMEGDQDQ